MNSEGNLKENQRGKLNFLRLILRKITNGATGFDLAYEAEKHQEFKRLLYDGILFYNTFIEIGNNKFIEEPDHVKKNYKAFRSIEDTEKFIFMVWLKDTIHSLEKDFEVKEDYAKFLQAKREEEGRITRERLRKSLTHCGRCGARIRSQHQVYCEECGVSFLAQIH